MTGLEKVTVRSTGNLLGIKGSESQTIIKIKVIHLIEFFFQFGPRVDPGFSRGGVFSKNLEDFFDFLLGRSIRFPSTPRTL